MAAGYTDTEMEQFPNKIYVLKASKVIIDPLLRSIVGLTTWFEWGLDPPLKPTPTSDPIAGQALSLSKQYRDIT